MACSVTIEMDICLLLLPTVPAVDVYNLMNFFHSLWSMDVFVIHNHIILCVHKWSQQFRNVMTYCYKLHRTNWTNFHYILKSLWFQTEFLIADFLSFCFYISLSFCLPCHPRTFFPSFQWMRQKRLLDDGLINNRSNYTVPLPFIAHELKFTQFPEWMCMKTTCSCFAVLHHKLP